jgi:hypothetical protein
MGDAERSKYSAATAATGASVQGLMYERRILKIKKGPVKV